MAKRIAFVDKNRCVASSSVFTFIYWVLTRSNKSDTLIVEESFSWRCAFEKRYRSRLIPRLYFEEYKLVSSALSLPYKSRKPLEKSQTLYYNENSTVDKMWRKI